MSQALRRLALVPLALAVLAAPAAAAKKEKKEAEKPKTAVEDPRSELWAPLALRSIGPAVTSGRIADIAVDPTDSKRWIVGAAAGGVWLTENAGTTWTAVFDGQGSYSIGAVAIAPSDPLVVWVGTGENNMQRVVAYGDGVYKSIDGGKSFTRTGLEASEHIGRILIDPRDPNVVWVAAQGPVWSAGGDRGLYKTVDGGATWTKVLEISENTGVTDIAFDPRDPDVVYAAAWQRRRHVWTMIGGGPESALYKTTDGGKSFRKLTKGLPKVDLGRIGLAVSPIDPDIVYLIVEAADGKSGFFRSSDRGESWEKRSSHSTSGNYYVELVADPHKLDRVYSMDTFLQVTDDGGSSFHELGEWNKHVDNHALWVDPADRDHYLVACDGGLYETFAAGKSWRFFGNLPVTQFYKVAVDDAEPFYNVYGGTQDNFTLGGPSRTRSAPGALNSDWTMVTTGDGFQPRVEPGDPDIVYAEAQYGSLVRYDRQAREETYLQPMPEPGDAPLKWNWDSPLVISPHSKTRLYFAAQRVFRSDDRGDHWTPISSDLSRGLDRNQLPVMGKIQRPDAVAKNGSTSPYGEVVALAESRLVEGLIYAGTDDGLIQVTEDGGGSWRKIESFPGVGEFAYVRKVEPSRFDADVVYAAFDRHKMGDFKPYILRSADRGSTWSSIASNLPEKGTAYVVIEDAVDPNLLFAGTEFGLFASQDRGGSWFALSGGLPTIQVRDLTIQERENDLVAATFGRGFYVLDDLTPLRFAAAHEIEGRNLVFPVRPALAYMESQKLGYRGKGFQGDDLYVADNPPFGAVFTVQFADELLSLKKARQKREEEAEKAGKSWPYPTLDEFRAEAAEEEPARFLVVRDDAGEVVRRIDAPTEKGIHRVAWDLRLPPPDPARLQPAPIVNAYSGIPQGAMVAPGSYTVSIEQRVGGVTTAVAGPEPFEVRALVPTKLTAPDRKALEQFLRDTTALHRTALGTSRMVGETQNRVALIEKALDSSFAADPALADEARRIDKALAELEVKLDGDAAIARRQEPTLPGLVDRSGYITSVQWNSLAAPTGTSRRQYELASAELGEIVAALRRLVEVDLPALESKLDAVGAPWTPGRVPAWPPSN